VVFPVSRSTPRLPHMRFGSSKNALPKVSPRDPSAPQTRQSSGLEQFCASLKSSESISILDTSGASQANISFITGLGHRISSDDVIGTMQQCFGDDFFGNQQAASNAHRFLEQTFTFPDESFGAALVWDTLQFLAPPVLEDAIQKLLRIMRPGGIMLMFFNASDKITQTPIYNYRIQDPKTLLQIPRGSVQKTQYFNNRVIERLFEKTSSLKFFLTRENVREIIVRK
jgi:hypothetical protein